MDRCAQLPAPTGYLDVERFHRRQAERDLGEGPHRLVLANDGGNPTNLSAYHHPDAASRLQAMRDKGLKGTGRGKGDKSKSSAGRDSRHSSSGSRSGYDQRNEDWSNYDRREMRSEPSSGSNQRSGSYWSSSRAGWVARNEQQQPRRVNWENLNEGNDRW